jgi:hypothetical protein
VQPPPEERSVRHSPGKRKGAYHTPEWLSWPTERVSRWVSAQRVPVVIRWPYNGTRRWYAAYRSRNPGVMDYLGVLIHRQAEHHRLVFDHGVSVILAPSFGAETLKRGEAYAR